MKGRVNMMNLRIGNNIVRIESFDVDTRENTTARLLGEIAKYAQIASVYLLADDHTFSGECLDAVKWLQRSGATLI